MVSASDGGLSQRRREMRGKRMASAGAVAGGAGEALEGDLEDEAVGGLGADGADRAEAVGGVVAHPAVDLERAPRR